MIYSSKIFKDAQRLNDLDGWGLKCLQERRILWAIGGRKLFLNTNFHPDMPDLVYLSECFITGSALPGEKLWQTNKMNSKISKKVRAPSHISIRTVCAQTELCARPKLRIHHRLPNLSSLATSMGAWLLHAVSSLCGSNVVASPIPTKVYGYTSPSS